MEEKPIYIKIDEFSKVEEIIKNIQKLVFEAKGKIKEIKDIKQKEEQSIHEWESKIKNMEHTLTEIQKYLR